MQPLKRPLKYRIGVTVVETDWGDYELGTYCLRCRRDLDNASNGSTVAELLQAARHRCGPVKRGKHRPERTFHQMEQEWRNRNGRDE